MELDGAQISILAIAVIILSFFLKYKITGSVKADFLLIGRGLDNGYPLFAFLACAGSLMSAATGIMAVADVFIPPGLIDTAVVTGKDKHLYAKRGTSYYVRAKNDARRYNENVSAFLYSTVRKGDLLLIERSRIFGEWKSVRVIRDGREVCRGRGSDMYWMLIMGVLFISTLYSFRLYFKMRGQRVMGSIVFIVAILFEMIPLAILLS